MNETRITKLLIIKITSLRYCLVEPKQQEVLMYSRLNKHR